jgi:hypothetical protein
MCRSAPGPVRLRRRRARKRPGLALCRLRYVGSATVWGFAIYLASKDGYDASIRPRGRPGGPPQEALDCAFGLYLADQRLVPAATLTTHELTNQTTKPEESNWEGSRST